MYFTKTSGMTSALATSIWLIISFVLAIVGAILLYVLFLNKKNEGKFKGFWGWLYDFLSFKKMFLEMLLKVTYLVAAIYITLSSFAMIGSSFLLFLVYLVLGNVIARVVYEFSLILLVICRNTTDIAKSLNKDSKEDK